MSKNLIILSERIVSKIYIIRSKKVMLDKDLAKLYGVKTKALNQAVKRNLKRFPVDFMFRLDKKEFDDLRSQIVISSWGGVRTRPFAFTEHGVAMLASVLKSDRAIKVNIQIIKTFIKLREYLISHKDLQEKLIKLEQRYDKKFKEIFEALRYLLKEKDQKREEIGFKGNKNR